MKAEKKLTSQKGKANQKGLFTCTEDLVIKLKSSENYLNFNGILKDKRENEKEARDILMTNHGKLSHKEIKRLKALVDEPYPYLHDGKKVSGPWFGRLLNCNTSILLKEDEAKINAWFTVLFDNNIPVERKLTILREGPYHISGLNTGFITLMLYLLDYSTYLIWFDSQHEGLKAFYPDLEKFTGNSKQYLLFNERAKEFARQFDFDHTELDWVLTRILKEY